MSDIRQGDPVWVRGFREVMLDRTDGTPSVVFPEKLVGFGTVVHSRPMLPDHPQLPSVSERLAAAGPDAVAVVFPDRRQLLNWLEYIEHIEQLESDDEAMCRSVREQIGTESTDGV